MGAMTTAVRAAGALVLVALLAGCTGDDGIVTTTPTPTVVAGSEEPGTTPSPTPSGGRELTDEELLALMPDDAAESDFVGAVATLQFYLIEYPRALKAVDGSVLDALSLPECGFCGDILEDVSYLDDSGHRLESGSLETTLQGLTGGLEGENAAVVSFEATQSEFRYVDSDGAAAGSSAPVNFTITARLVRGDLIWRVAGVSIDEI